MLKLLNATFDKCSFRHPSQETRLICEAAYMLENSENISIDMNKVHVVSRMR